MLYMVTFTINIPPMLVYIPYMDPMGMGIRIIQERGSIPFFTRIFWTHENRMGVLPWARWKSPGLVAMATFNRTTRGFSLVLLSVSRMVITCQPFF